VIQQVETQSLCGYICKCVCEWVRERKKESVCMCVCVCVCVWESERERDRESECVQNEFDRYHVPCVRQNTIIHLSFCSNYRSEINWTARGKWVHYVGTKLGLFLTVKSIPSFPSPDYPHVALTSYWIYIMKNTTFDDIKRNEL